MSTSLTSVEGRVPLDRKFDVAEISQDEVDELLVFGLTDVLDERSGLKLVSELPSGQTILGETVIPVVGD